jgi:hypothetical protein
MTVICLGLFLLVFVIRYAGVLRLTIPLLYALVMPTVFHSWFYAHYALAYGIWYGIWYGMLGLVALSWGVTIVRRLR